MNVVCFVVELERCCSRGAQYNVGLGDLDGEIQRRLVPGGMSDCRKIFGTRISVLAPAILILEPQLERLRQIESIERAVEARRAADPKRRSRNGCRRIDLEQRRERRRCLPLTAQR